MINLKHISLVGVSGLILSLVVSNSFASDAFSIANYNFAVLDVSNAGKPRFCCSQSHWDYINDIRQRWQDEYYDVDPNKDPKSQSTPPLGGTPPPNEPTSDVEDDKMDVFVTSYSPACVCGTPFNNNSSGDTSGDTSGDARLWKISFAPFVDQILCCPGTPEEFSDKQLIPKAYTASGSLRATSDSGVFLRCCKFAVWEKTHDIALANQAFWEYDDDPDTDEDTSRNCCRPGFRSDKSGDMAWIKYGVDYKGDEDVGCCSNQHMFASETCCMKSFEKDKELYDENGERNTVFYNANVKATTTYLSKDGKAREYDDLGKNKCCAKDTLTSFESLFDYKDRKTGKIDPECCYAVGGYYREDENGNQICCNGMKKFDIATGKWGTEDSDECCVGEGFTRVYPNEHQNDENRTICCIDGSTKEAIDGGTPNKSCCSLAGSRSNVLVKWIPDKEICCKAESWVWKYADTYDNVGGMCTLKNQSDTQDAIGYQDLDDKVSGEEILNN